MGPDESFHLYLLIGQSNMSGRGAVEAQDQEPPPRVFALNKANEWIPAVDPIHFDKPTVGTGPGLTFGQTMADHDLSACIGLIPCAVGGTPITVWQRGGYYEQTGTYPYDDAVARAKIAMQDGILKAILWHQGESDSDNEDSAKLYGDRLATLINNLRTDLAAPDVPFIVATLGDFLPNEFTEVEIVNQILRRLPERIDHTACVDSAGLGHKGDDVHFSAQAARELGRGYAEAVKKFVG